MKKTVLFLLLTAFSCCTFVSCGGGDVSPSCKKCADFKTQTEAKAYAQSNSSCGKDLDADNDGIYCESLPQ